MWPPSMVYALVIALAPVPEIQPAEDVKVVETFDSRYECLAVAREVEVEQWGTVVVRCAPVMQGVGT